MRFHSTPFFVGGKNKTKIINCFFFCYFFAEIISNMKRAPQQGQVKKFFCRSAFSQKLWKEDIYSSFTRPNFFSLAPPFKTLKLVFYRNITNAKSEAFGCIRKLIVLRRKVWITKNLKIYKSYNPVFSKNCWKIPMVEMWA